jgi:hypothetical protein
LALELFYQLSHVAAYQRDVDDNNAAMTADQEVDGGFGRFN